MSGVSAAAIIGGGDQENRSVNDFYPTPPEVSHSLMWFLSQRNLMPRHIWEPAAGGDAMVNVFREYTCVTGTELTRGQDFFTQPIPAGVDAIITNPPFFVSARFIEHAHTFRTDVVAMVLKSQYWHAQERVGLYEKHPPAYVLPLTWRPDFDGRGNPTMDMMWTVWVRGDTGARYMPLPRIRGRTLF